MRIPLATSIKTRTGAPSEKDARLVNSYVEVKGEQSVVRKRPIAQGGVAVGSGTAQGGIGFNLGGTDYVYTFNGDTGALDTLATAGTTWNSVTAYSIGDHAVIDFVDYWALADNTNSQPPSGNWSTSYVPAVPAIGYATWNPAGTALVLSNGDLSVSDPDDVSSSVRSTVGKSSGKWYWEIQIFNANCGIGVGDINASLGLQVGIQATAWGFSLFSIGDSGKTHNNVYVEPYGNTSVAGDIVSVLLDADNGLISFWQNGVDAGVAYTGLSGTLYAMFSTNFDVPSPYATANFGSSAFAYSVPIGYNSGLYT